MKFWFINGYFFNKDKAAGIYCKYQLYNGEIFKANLGSISEKELLNISETSKLSLISTSAIILLGKEDLTFLSLITSLIIFLIQVPFMPLLCFKS